MNLMQGLLNEMNRVREAIKEYESLPGGAGFLGASFMKLDIKRAEQAIAENDVIKMLLAYEKLKEIEYESQ